MSIKTIIKTYQPLIESTVALFAPFVEVAIHDLISGKIVAIYGHVTNRHVGDPSPVNQLHLPVSKFPEVFEPYYETNYDGRKIKCSTVTIRDESKKPIALICFNFDVSVFENMQVNLTTFLAVKKNTANPVELFSSDWQATIDVHIAKFLQQHKLILGELTAAQKKSLVEELSRHGVFFIKNAAPYIAAKLDTSRATVYNYLKVLHADN